MVCNVLGSGVAWSNSSVNRSHLILIGQSGNNVMSLIITQSEDANWNENLP